MTNYNFNNAIVCRWAHNPAKVTDVISIPAQELTMIGIVKADSGYTCKPEEKVTTSTQRTRILSNKLAVKFEEITPYAPTPFIKDLDGQVVTFVLVESDLLPDFDSVNTTESYKTLAELLGSTPLPSGLTCTVLKPIDATVEEDVKIGGGKVVPFVITGEKIVAGDKDNSRKLKVAVVAE